jgi:hypothetical protein
MTNLGKWDRWYVDLDEPHSYGSTETYQIGAEFLADCDLVEDWGCGKGFMRTLIEPARYRGIDGSRTRFADTVADLAEYTSTVDGVFMRHVLEHDWRWEQILTNAAASARRKLVVVLFTPLHHTTNEIAWNEDPGVPDISFALDDLLGVLDGFTVRVDHLVTATQYEVETVLLCEAKQ